MLLDVKTGKNVRLLRGPFCQQSRVVRDGKTLYTYAFDLGQMRMFAIEVATGTVKALTDKGSVAGFDVRGKTQVIQKRISVPGAQLFVSEGKTSWEANRRSQQTSSGGCALW